MIQFACAACGKGFTVPDEAAGKTGKCNNCGERNKVPVPAASASGGITDDWIEPSPTQGSPEPLSTDFDDDWTRSSDLSGGQPVTVATNTPPNPASPLSGLPPLNSTAQPRSPLNLQACVDCGQLVSIRAAQCPKCGCPLLAAQVPAPIKLPKSATLAPSSLGIVISAVGVVGILFFAFVFNSTVTAESLGHTLQVHNLNLGEIRLIGIVVSSALFLFGGIPSRITFN